MAGSIITARHGHVTSLCIDRVAKRNALTPSLIADYSRALAEYDSDPEARCLLVHGAGDHFTAGLDLNEAGEVWERGGDLYPKDLPHICDIRPPHRRKPLVMAVQGVTYTFGVEMMLAADVVVAADNCRFSVLEVTRGIMASAGATIRLPLRAGWGSAMRWLLTGDEFDTGDAMAMGLVQEVTTPGQQFDRAMQISQRIATGAAPLAVQATLSNARLAVERGGPAAAAEFDAIRLRLRASADFREGLASFRERRPARFTGH